MGAVFSMCPHLFCILFFVFWQVICWHWDIKHASWSSTHEETRDVVKHNDFVGGQFIWTCFDYIGKPTPYAYPARSSYFFGAFHRFTSQGILRKMCRCDKRKGNPQGTGSRLKGCFCSFVIIVIF